MKIDDKQMNNVYGGESGVGSSFLGYFSNLFKTIYSIGQGFGGAIRRIAGGNICPF